MKETLLVVVSAGIGFGLGMFVDLINSIELSFPIKAPQQEIYLGGYCVDNDMGVEQYKISFETQSKMFSTTTCTFRGVRQDIIGCTGDDFYSYNCLKD